MRDDTREHVLSLSLKFFEEWDSGLERDAFHQARDATVRQIMELPRVSAALSERDVMDMLQEVVLWTQKSLSDLSPEERRAYVAERLFVESDFVAVYPVYSLYEFPAGTKIGRGCAVDFTTLPEKTKEILESLWETEFTRRPGMFKTVEEYLADKRECLLLEFRVKANGFGRAIDVTTEAADEALMVLQHLYHPDLSADDLVIYAEGRGFQSSSKGGEGWSRYTPILASEFEFWTEILTKINPTDLEERMRRALRLVGLAAVVKQEGLSFVLLTIALESLLLAKGDSDYLRQRLAEKVAFLLETDMQSRIALYNAVKGIYDRRSAFVHSGTENVTVNELRELESTFWRVVRKIEDLRGEGYVSVSKSDSGKWIDALFEALKFQ